MHKLIHFLKHHNTILLFHFLETIEGSDSIKYPIMPEEWRCYMHFTSLSTVNKTVLIDMDSIKISKNTADSMSVFINMN